VDRTWTPVGTVLLGVTLGGLALVALAVASSGGFVPLLDHVNLAFHEAGHKIYGVLGERAELYGGTLGQLTFPAVSLGIFWYRRHTASTTVVGFWLAENLVNIARYVADARAQELPLVGGGEHDWEHILTRWGALASDLKVARAIKLLGWAGMLAAAVFLVWRWHRTRADS
jgi:hypothetical protein